MQMMKLDPDGYMSAGIFFVLAMASLVCYYAAGFSPVLWISGLSGMVFLACAWFFRDPERTVAEVPVVSGRGDGSDKGGEDVVSAADGIVLDISRVEADGFEAPALRIAVFMRVYDVHVNRSPVSGTVLKTEHRPGKKHSAFTQRAAYENECGDTDIETSYGLVRVRQIAGLVARRVVTRVQAGDVLEWGDRIGLIRFGSRVDVFLPPVYDPVIQKGDFVRAGETIIARLTLHHVD